MRLHLYKFLGMTPRVSRALISSGTSVVAINCNLDSGEIRSLRAPEIAAAAPGKADYKTLLRYDDKWLVHASDADFRPGFLSADTDKRMYFTSEDDVPSMFIKTGVTETGEVATVTTKYDLGIDAPSAAPTLSKSGTPTGTTYTRYYAYTFLTALGEESSPSPISASITWQSGETVTIAGMDTTVPGTHNVTHKKIYRSIVGSTGQSFQYVKTVSLATASTTDTVADNNLGSGLITSGWIKPPADMQGLISMPGGFFAGFSGKTVCFSEPLFPHAWPISYRVNVDYEIVGLGANGNILVVLTTSKIYLINVPHPAQRTITKLTDIIPCISKRGIVSTLYGVLFPSTDGLYLAGGSGVKNITSQVVTAREWALYKPDTLISAYFDSKYFGFFSGGCFFFEPFGSDPSFKQVNINTSGIVVTDVNTALYYYTTANGDGTIWEYEGSAFSLNAQWKSKVFLTDLLNLAAAQIFADYPIPLTEDEWNERVAGLVARIIAQYATDYRGAINADEINAVPLNGSVLDFAFAQYAAPSLVNFNLYADSELVYSTQVNSDEPFPLPALPNARKWEIEIVSKGVNILEMLVATSFEELSLQAETGVLA